MIQAINQLELADLTIRHLRRTCKRLTSTVFDQRKDDVIAMAPHIYTLHDLQEAQDTIPMAIIIVTPIGILPPPKFRWRYMTYFPTQFEIKNGENRYNNLINSQEKPTFQVLQMSPDGEFQLLNNTSTNFITLAQALKLRDDFPSWYQTPTQIPTECIWKSSRDRLLGRTPPPVRTNNYPPLAAPKQAGSPVGGTDQTDGNRQSRPDPPKKEETPNKDTQSHVEASTSGHIEQNYANPEPHRSQHVTVAGTQRKRPNYKDDPNLREIFYEYRGKKSNVPEYTIRWFNPDQGLPNTIFHKNAQEEYDLVNDKAKLEEYIAKEKMRSDRPKGKRTNVRSLQQIRHLQPEVYAQMEGTTPKQTTTIETQTTEPQTEEQQKQEEATLPKAPADKSEPWTEVVKKSRKSQRLTKNDDQPIVAQTVTMVNPEKAKPFNYHMFALPVFQQVTGKADPPANQTNNSSAQAEEKKTKTQTPE